MDLSHRFAGEVAAITGGAGGIGRAIADRLASEGAAIAILDRNLNGAEKVAAGLVDRGCRAIAVECDVTDRDQIKAACDSTARQLGSLTVLINNAGIVRKSPFLELTDAVWSDVLATNLTGSFIVAQEVASRMVQLGRGRIVNMASVAGQIAHCDQTAYSVSKAGIIALTRSMAFELARHGITVNAIAPGTIATDFAMGNLAEDGRRRRLERIPVGRFGDAAEVAAAVAFLASADASYLSGSVVTIDGGLVPGGVYDPPR
jgi:NAD(P)-dependent dehydrogenase (short-subunit alcohol dehydrogenase family)